MVEKYPENLIVEDAWGALPLLYAVWGDAPSEIKIRRQSFATVQCDRACGHAGEAL